MTLLVSKCKANTMTEVSEPEFVRVCILDPELGTLVTKIYRWGGQRDAREKGTI